jgi:hypothetical protein
MAVYPGNDAGAKRNIGLPAIIIALVVLLILMVWLYEKNFGPQPPPPPTGVAKTNHDYINSLYDRTNGDYSKLTDDEKLKVNKMTMGHGQIAFENIKK